MNKHNLRDKNGRFINRLKATTDFPIVNGRLYAWNGVPIRVRKQCNNGLFLVSYHKRLSGFVRAEELELLPKSRVRRYLQNT